MSEDNSNEARDFRIVELESALSRLGKALRKIKIPNTFLSRDIDINSFWQLAPLRDNSVLRPSEIALQLGLDSSTVSRNIQKLEKQNLVERREDPTDARAYLIALTDDGRQILDIVSQARRKKFESVLSHWDHDEISSLLYQLTRFTDELESGPRNTN